MYAYNNSRPATKDLMFLVGFIAHNNIFVYYSELDTTQDHTNYTQIEHKTNTQLI